MENSRPLIIFTNMFPYGHAENFLMEELTHLQKHFGEIIIVPNQQGTLSRKLPASIRVESDFADNFSSSSFLKKLHRLMTAFSCGNTYKELARDPSILLKPKHLKTLFYFVSQSEYYYKWLCRYLEEHPHLQNGVFYSYWLHVQALGISLLKSRLHHTLYQVSRAHSFEIYPEDYTPPYIPFREISLPTIDRIYTISNHGKERLLRDFGPLIQKVTTSRLGIHDPGFLNPINSKNTLELVSTSLMVVEKRLEILIYALKLLSERNCFERISWTHFGNGPLQKELTTLAQNLLGNKIDWKFPGYLTSENLLTYYKTHPIDLFVNTSRTEGIPVSIMEAQACGIPVLATNVGGVAEIVHSGVGVLLSNNPTPQDIAEAIVSLTCDKSKLAPMRQAARENWSREYDAACNFEEFARTLLH